MATVLFFAPHQDDETLTMGAAISNHVNAGHDVHVILATDGINSGARDSTGLSRPAFSHARDDEFRRACRALGVKSINTHISRHSNADGALSVPRGKDVILDFMERYPDAWVKTHTDRPTSGYAPRHADHLHLGQAALALKREGVIENLRYYIEPYEVDQFRADYPQTQVGVEHTGTPDDVRLACQEYRAVDLANSKYGIGYRSVPRYIDQVAHNPVSYVHA